MNSNREQHLFALDYLSTLLHRRKVSSATSAPVSFGLIPHDHWYQPDWVDEKKAREGRIRLETMGIIYAGECILRFEYSPSLYALITRQRSVPKYVSVQFRCRFPHYIIDAARSTGLP